MMQVNLLNPQTRFQQKPGKGEDRNTLYWLGGLIGVLLFIYIGLVFSIIQADNRIITLNKEITAKEAATKAVELETKLQKDVEQKTRIVKDIEDGKRIFSPYFKKIATMVPRQVNITEWGITPENQWNISGTSQDYGRVAQFVSALQSEKNFDSVIILSLTREPNQQISYNLRINLPPGGKANE